MSRRPTARDVALDALLRVEGREAFSNRALEAAVRQAGLGARDRGLASELVYGTLTWQGRLDAVLGRFARKPLSKLPAAVRMAMRSAAFQLLFLDRVTIGLAVSAAVSQSRAAAGPALAGVANGILRAIARERDALRAEDFSAAGPEADLSIPAWLWERWAHRHGPEEARRLCVALNERPRLHVRIRGDAAAREALLARWQADGARVEPLSPPLGMSLQKLEGPFDHDTFRRGSWTAQDAGAQWVGHLLGAADGATALDVCAGTGGKALLLADQVGPAGHVLAVDLHEAKLRTLEREAKRLGVGNVSTRAGDALDPELLADVASRGPFSLVLLDAPCTGLGTVRRHPEIKWRRTPGDIAQASQLQARLLRSVAPLTAPGGVLVYAVCSLEPEEGEDLVAAFLGSDARFAPAPFPQVEGVDWQALQAGSGAIRTLPHRDESDGFQAFRLRRRS